MRRYYFSNINKIELTRGKKEYLFELENGSSVNEIQLPTVIATVSICLISSDSFDVIMNWNMQGNEFLIYYSIL